MLRWIRTIREFMGWMKRLVFGDGDVKRLTLSECDSLRILDLIENPPGAPDRLVHVAKAGRRVGVTTELPEKWVDAARRSKGPDEFAHHADIDLAPERIRLPVRDVEL